MKVLNISHASHKDQGHFSWEEEGGEGLDGHHHHFILQGRLEAQSPPTPPGQAVDVGGEGKVGTEEGAEVP